MQSEALPRPEVSCLLPILGAQTQFDHCTGGMKAVASHRPESDSLADPSVGVRPASRPDRCSLAENGPADLHETEEGNNQEDCESDPNDKRLNHGTDDECHHRQHEADQRGYRVAVASQPTEWPALPGGSLQLWVAAQSDNSRNSTRQEPSKTEYGQPEHDVLANSDRSHQRHDKEDDRTEHGQHGLTDRVAQEPPRPSRRWAGRRALIWGWAEILRHEQHFPLSRRPELEAIIVASNSSALLARPKYTR